MKIKTLTNAILALVVGSAGLVAQDYWGLGLSRLANADPIFGSATSLTTVQAAVVRWGGGGVASVQVTSTALLFTATGYTATTDLPTCPVGGTTGTVLLTAATCNTVEEIVDIINATSYWRMFPLALTFADTTNNSTTSDTGIFNVLAATSASNPEGLVITATGSGASGMGHVATALMRDTARADIRYWLTGNNGINPNPFAGTRSILLYDQATATFTGTAYKRVIAATPNYTISAGSSKETESTLLQVAGAATTVASTSDFTPYGVIGPSGARLVVKYGNLAATVDALTVGTQYSYGIIIPTR